MSRKPGYLLVMGTPSDQERMDAYHDMIPPIYQDHGGYRLVMGSEGGGLSYLSGTLDILGIMLARFPSPESVSEFWWSDDYRKAYRVRKDAGRFSAVGLPGLDDGAEPIGGDKGFLMVLASPESPGRWRRFAETFSDGIKDLGATLLIDDGPEAIERLESRLPGSHVLLAMFSTEEDAKAGWSNLQETMGDLVADAEPFNVVVLKGLPDDHPGRLTK